jgi:hypothetical protein
MQVGREVGLQARERDVKGNKRMREARKDEGKERGG